MHSKAKYLDDGLVTLQEVLFETIGNEKKGQKDLDLEIQRLQRQIGQERRLANLTMSSGGKGTGNGPSQQPGAPGASGASSGANLRDKKELGHKIVLLENRLDGVMTNFNATLAQNATLRKDIDHLVQERSNFNDNISKLQRKLGQNKKTVADITEMAILAFDQRDESQSKIAALQEKNEKDAATYAAELKELQRTLDHDEKLKDFLFHKSNDRAFAADYAAEQDREKDRKEAEAKDMEHSRKYREAFERIRKVAPHDSGLDKIVADFVKVEDQNFALFNYVTEMNNQVEGLQEGIAKLRADIKEAKGRGNERERQQKDQLAGMERKLAASTAEANATEAKVELMEGVITKLKVGCKELYLVSQCGSTPMLSLLDGGKAVMAAAPAPASETAVPQAPPEKGPIVTELNIIMYLDMIHERLIELKCVAQFVDHQRAAKAAAAASGSSISGHDPHGSSDHRVSSKRDHHRSASPPAVGGRSMKRMPSSAVLLGQAGDDDSVEDLSVGEAMKPFEMAALKARAFKITQKERRDEMTLLHDPDRIEDHASQHRRGSKSKKGSAAT